jgi:hypothetical protein
LSKREEVAMFWKKVMGLVGLTVVPLMLMGGQNLALGQVPEGVLGKWGYIVLGKGGKGSWFGYKTEAGTIVFNEDGTLSNTYKESADRCPGPEYCLGSVSDELYYTVGEGGVILIEDATKCIVADSRDLMLCDGTMGMEKGGEKFFISAVNLDEVNPYSDSDLSGEYFMGNYEKDLYGESRGRNRLASAITTIDGSGKITSVSGFENGDGDLHPLILSDIPIHVNQEGSFTVSDFATGYLDLGRKVALVSNPSAFYPATGDDFAAHVILKRHDRDYSTSDLSGRWAFVGFGDRAGTFRAETGLILCDSSGQCLFSTKTVNVNGSPKYLTAERSLYVDTDGSVNSFHLTTDKPHISGALGNDGNAMLLLMNESSDTTNDRLLGLAVRYTTGNLPGFADLALTDLFVPGTALQGQKITLDYTVENQGEGVPKKRAKVSFRLRDKEGSVDVSLGTQSIPKLEPGQVFDGSKTVRIKGSIPPGTYTLSISVDSSNLILESREENNSGSAELVVQPGS